MPAICDGFFCVPAAPLAWVFGWAAPPRLLAMPAAFFCCAIGACGARLGTRCGTLRT